MAASIRAGEVLAGRYRMVDLLAEAEGGWFWRAHDEILERTVAIHLIASDDPRAVDLMDAARRSARLDDRRNLRVLDADLTDELCYVVNEWGQGKSLDLALTTDGPLSPARSAWVVAEVADTIAAAHAAGVTHDQLLPEHVLLDDNGQVRVIGMAVDAALHGVPAHQKDEDVTHLASLLYACLTARWPGPGESVVLPPPRENGKLLRPRQVRAGIPRALDLICEEMLLGSAPHARPLGLGVVLGQRSEHDLTTAAGVREALEEFLGDDDEGNPHGHTVMTEAPRTTPTYALSPEQRVAAGLSPEPHWAHDDQPEWGGPVDDGSESSDESAGPNPEGGRAGADGPDGSDGPDGVGVVGGAGRGTGPGGTAESPESPESSESPESPEDGEVTSVAQSPAVDIPTEAGMPVFHEGDEDVEWLRARAHKPAPPPAFEQPEERPLFAPTPGDGTPVRRPRPGRTVQELGHGDDYWPWDTGTGHASDTTNGSGGLPVVREPVPGRSWLRLAWIIGFAALLLLTMVAAYQLGTGRTSDQDPEPERSSNSADQTPSGEALEIEATDFDPQGDSTLR